MKEYLSDPRQMIGIYAGIVFILVILFHQVFNVNFYWKRKSFHFLSLEEKEKNFGKESESYYKLDKHKWNFFKLPVGIIESIWPKTEK